MHVDKLEFPTGQLVSPQEILVGIALVEINSDLEKKILMKLLRYVRAIKRIKNVIRK